MATYLYLLHSDFSETHADNVDGWGAFIAGLRKGGHFIGGGTLGEGCTRRLGSTSDAVTKTIAGYMVITADNLEQAAELLSDNPYRRFRRGAACSRSVTRPNHSLTLASLVETRWTRQPLCRLASCFG